MSSPSFCVWGLIKTPEGIWFNPIILKISYNHKFSIELLMDKGIGHLEINKSFFINNALFFYDWLGEEIGVE